ncbi:MAG: acetyl-CoA carboxylase biotin carboxyl carrier protein [Chlamydiae bacterium]|nr:acetyl-CoA carboxylase biotin carboxyl carrier protein [Chlamydiota bacterium]MBI3267156.1 acetyl-CoA carboxylase biotin carboxyl carrier protein [Chlamydiota bacterium]
MNIKEIQEMIKLMQENDIVEFQLERNGFKIALKRGKAQVEATSSSAIIPSHVSPAVEKEEKIEEKRFLEITSPMVGTFYSAGSPESAPYVQPHQQIQKGDVVCIIEAMKVMNEIKAEISGTIAEILVENGQPVEFGQALFKIKP